MNEILVQYLFILILGWAAGIVVNYLADVLPIKRRLAIPFCLTCEISMQISNYLIWPRRCQNCGKRRSVRVWLLEFLFILTSIWLWASPPKGLGFLMGLILLMYFGLVTVIDLEHRLIMHPVSLAGVALGLGIGTWLHGLKGTLIGGVAGFLGMLAVYYMGIVFVRLSARLRGLTIEEEEGIGFGDVTLSGVIGLLLGWPGIIAGLVFAILLGGAVSLVYIFIMFAIRRYRPSLALPYGPFIVASATLLLYFKDLFSG